MLSLCVLLDEKWAKLNSLDFEESSSDQDSNTEQPDEQADNSQRDLDAQQFSLLEELYDLDKPFFYYIQTCYSLICQSIFNCFKIYIEKRANHLAYRDKAFSIRNLNRFPTYGNSEESKVLKFPSPYKDQKLIDELWQNELENISFLNLYGYNCLHLFEKMFQRLETQIEKEESKLPLHLVVDLEAFPLPNLFWNSSFTNLWEYSLIVHDFRSSARICVHPVVQLREYYQPDFDPWASDFECDPNND